MTRAQIQPWHIALGLSLLIAVFVSLWPTGVGRDYLNHLARTHIEGHLASDPDLQRFFGLSFDFIPDLTMDLIVPWLSHMIGTYAAGAVTLWLAFMLAPLAGLALSKALFGRVTWPSLIGFLTLFNVNMDWGFVNYYAATGLALFAFILWLKMRPNWQRTLVFFPLALVLCVNHALAFLMFGFLALSWELIAYARQERGTLTTFLTKAVIYDVTAMIGGLIFLGASVLSASDLPQGTADFFSLKQKAYALSSATEFYNRPLGVFAGLAVLGGLYFSIRSGWFKFASGMGWLCGAVLGLVVLMPTSVLGIWGLHLRFTAVLIILVGACVQVTPAFSLSRQRLVSVVVGALGFSLIVNGAVQMARIDAIVKETRAALDSVPRGSTVLIGISSENIHYAAVMNAAASIVIDRSGYVPGLFTNTSPVDIHPDYAARHMPQSQPLTPAELTLAASREPIPSQNGYWSLAYARGWTETFDYLIFYQLAEDPPFRMEEICAVRRTEDIVLYTAQACVTD